MLAIILPMVAWEAAGVERSAASIGLLPPGLFITGGASAGIRQTLLQGAAHLLRSPGGISS